jgi:hypothetical protein
LLEELLFTELLEDFALLEEDFALLDDCTELEEATLLEEGGSAELDSMMGASLELDTMTGSGCFVNLSPGFRTGRAPMSPPAVSTVTPSREMMFMVARSRFAI